MLLCSFASVYCLHGKKGQLCFVYTTAAPKSIKAVKMVEVTHWQKIGIGLTAFGSFFVLLEVLLFDTGLSAIGNILFISGLPFIVGFERTFQLFQPPPYNRTRKLVLMGGLVVALIGWPKTGMLVEGKKTVRSELRSFAEKLAPSESEVRRAAENTDKITRALHAHFKGRGVVDRIVPFGSYAKKVSIRDKMDIDIIVYINGQDPPFDTVVEELYTVVRREFTWNCEKNSFGVYFSFNDLEIDLLPARNFLPSDSSHDQDVDRTERTQYNRALEYVRSIPQQERHLYSTSLSYASVLFQKDRDSFSHSLSRLAKYWSLNVPVDCMKPRSSIMEYLGAYAADQESYSQDMLEGFQCFLELFESSDSLNIVWTQFYNENDIPGNVRRKRPLLLDPCNPFNNLLDQYEFDNADCLRQMRPYAEATLQRLRDTRRKLGKGEYVEIEELFWQDDSLCVHP